MPGAETAQTPAHLNCVGRDSPLWRSYRKTLRGSTAAFKAQAAQIQKVSDKLGPRLRHRVVANN